MPFATQLATVLAVFVLAAPAASAQLFVNEILADNGSVLADEAGEFDDWIEIYNAGPDAVDLTGYTLSDDSEELDKFTFESVTIEAGGYLLVWADGDPDQGPLHADFGLGAGGEEVALGRPDGAGGFELVDGFEFGEQTEDVSFGRATDGGAALVIFPTPTPLAMNAGGVANETRPNASTFAITASAPNPTRGAFSLALDLPTASTVEGEIVDVLGRVVARIAPRNASAGSVQIQQPAMLGAGVYLVSLRAQSADGVTRRATRQITVVR